MSFGFGIGDIIAVTQLAVQVCESFKGAPQEFRELSSEVESLHEALQGLESYAKNHTIDSVLQRRLQTLTRGAEAVLLDIERLLTKRARLNGKGVWFFDRLLWPSAKMRDLRLRLISQSSQLILWHSQLQVENATTIRIVRKTYEPVQGLIDVLIPCRESFRFAAVYIQR